MIENIVISATDLSKSYKLYQTNRDRLKEVLSFSKKKYYKEFKALDNINFNLKKGERLGIIGKNGSGKSTLLKLITNILLPSAGSIEVKGDISALIELGAGFNPDFTGLENIYFYGSILGFSRADMNKKLEEIINFADIGDFINQPIKIYSSGMKSRLAFAVAISVEPDILIIDEVLSVGDMFFKQKCINKLKEMLNRGLTLFFVSHNINEVKALCNKALYLKQGKQIAFGNAEEVCNLYQNEMTQSNDILKEKAIKPIQGEIATNYSSSSKILNTIVNRELKYYYCDPSFSSRLSSRSGSKEIEFKSLVLYNSCNIVTSKIEAFEKVFLRLSFMANENIAYGAAIGILCRDKFGSDIFAINSDLFDLYLPELYKKQCYVFELELMLPLVKGIYSLNIGVKPNPSEDYFYDRCFNAAVFEITKPKWQKETGGVIYHYAKNYILRTTG